MKANNKEGAIMTGLPSFDTYGNYKSDNYGAHALVFSTHSGQVYFSYQTPVAFFTNQTGLVVRQNDWGPTTGKHLNRIDGGGPGAKGRLPGAHFEQVLNHYF